MNVGAGSGPIEVDGVAATPRAGPVPVTILTGFLGSGKTTLLNRLLRLPGFGKCLVVVNEFGSVGIDHLLVENLEGETLLLASGCLCCAARDDLSALLLDLARRRRLGGLDFDRIVVETSGLADPGPILNAALTEPVLWSAVSIDAVVTLVDAVEGLATLDAYPEALRQVAVADRLLLSKTDRIDTASTGPLVAALRAVNPLADIATSGDFGAAELMATLEARPMPRPPVGGLRGMHRSGLSSVTLVADRLERGRLEAFLSLLTTRFGAGLLRMKGIVGLLGEDPARPVVLHAVRHVLHPSRRLPTWPDADRRSRIVVILQDVPAGAVEALWEDCCAGPAVDRPDAFALLEAFGEDRGLLER